MSAKPGDKTNTSARRPTGPAEEAWSLMRQFVDAHSRHRELVDELGFSLGAGRGKILFQLAAGSRTLTELAQANGFDPPYTTLVVDKLESHGLVERQTHPDDRRRKLVSLTAAGRAAVARADTILRRPPVAIHALRAAELRQLAKLVRRLIDADEATES